MNYFLILAIFCILRTTWCVENKTQRDAEDVADCARELHIDVNKYADGIDLSDYLENPTDEKTCMLACAMRKTLNEEGLSLYKGFLSIINEAYQKGFHGTDFTQQDLLSKVERCYVNELEECKFFKCVDVFISPFFDVFAYDILNSITTGMIHSLLD